MQIVKLDAIPSTNDFLKEMARNQSVENFTVVMAESQTHGKGQRGAEWLSQDGKNLIISVYIDRTSHFSHGIFSMNVAVAMAIFDTFSLLDISDLSVKWPNDIMAGNKKMGGILIENSLRSDGTFTSVIGIGLNINQTDFSALPLATSLSNLMGRDYDKSIIAEKLLSQLESYLSPTANQDQLWKDYRINLFRLEVESKFELPDGTFFSGIIRDVDYQGRIIIEKDGREERFSLKEIKLIY